jgi:hypothetical protein
MSVAFGTSIFMLSAARRTLSNSVGNVSMSLECVFQSFKVVITNVDDFLWDQLSIPRQACRYPFAHADSSLLNTSAVVT